MSDYQRADGLTARTDTSTPCRCGRPDCDWTEADDVQRDRMETAQRITDAEDAVGRVRDLHREYVNVDPWGVGRTYSTCEGCVEENGTDNFEPSLWPCPTIRALDGEAS